MIVSTLHPTPINTLYKQNAEQKSDDLLNFLYYQSFILGVDFYFDFFVYFEWERAVSGDFGGYVDVVFVVLFACGLSGAV